MGVIAFLGLGVIAGAIARLLFSGRKGPEWTTTLVLGVAGSLVGGWLGTLIFGIHMREFFSIKAWTLAVVGSITVLLVGGVVIARRDRT